MILKIATEEGNLEKMCKLCIESSNVLQKI